MSSERVHGWTFFLGAALAAAATASVVVAIFVEPWRHVIQGLGASVPAIGVIGAALIAYDGAIAKVRLDFIENERKERRRRLQFLLLTEYTMIEFLDRYDAISAFMLLSPVDSEGNDLPADPIEPEVFEIEEPEQFQEIWENLDLLNSSAVIELRSIRLRQRELMAYVQHHDHTRKGRPFRIAIERDNPQIRSLLSKIRRSCDSVLEDTQALIAEAEPKLKDRNPLERVFDSGFEDD